MADPRIDKVRLEKDYTYHPPRGDQPDRYTRIRALAKEFASEIMVLTPISPEQSNAFTKLDEVVFWANAAIARNE